MEVRVAAKWLFRAGTFVLLPCGAALTVALTPTTLRSQAATHLERVERLADRGETREARQLLEQWQREASASASAAERAHAWFLAGRLADDAEQAELSYLKVVIEGSTSRFADDALLRLAQYQIALGEHARGIEYLGRLRREYPTSELAPNALLWVARAANALGDPDRACAAAEQGLRETPPTDTLLNRALTEATRGCQPGSGTFSVQVAALKDAVAAQTLARRLLEDGFDAWVLNATGSDSLYRVRVGRDLEESEAQSLLGRLVGAGYSPFLVAGPSGPGGPE